MFTGKIVMAVLLRQQRSECNLHSILLLSVQRLQLMWDRTGELGKVDRVRQGVRCTQIMILAYSVIAMILVFFFSKYLTYLFISPSETKVIEVSVLYFHTVFWCYPFLGSIFLYRNTLQGLGYGLVPMLGGVFELAARSAIVVLVAGKTSFAGVCLSDPAAWISALIPLIPYYIYVTRKWKKQGKIAI